MNMDKAWVGIVFLLLGVFQPGAVMSAQEPGPGIKGDLIPDVVIGQRDFTGQGLNPEPLTKWRGWGTRATGSCLFFPGGIWSDGKRLLIADYDNNRVLCFNEIPKENFQSGDLQLGGPGVTTCQYVCYGRPCMKWVSKGKETEMRAKTDKSMAPATVVSDGEKIFVSDHEYSRVLVYNQFPAESNPDPDFVLGQPDLTCYSWVPNNGSVSAKALAHPVGLTVKDGKLYVCDQDNNRILIYNLPIKENGQAAEIVLGQPDFNSSEENCGGLSAKSLSYPRWVFLDGKKLFVSDTGNHRVLIWNKIPDKNFQPADVVIGAPDFTTRMYSYLQDSGKITPQTLSYPGGLWSDGKALYLCDSECHRVLIYDQIPEKNNAAPDRFLGQPDLYGRNGLDMAKWGIFGGEHHGHPSVMKAHPGKLNFPMAIWGDQNNLYISDYWNHRVLVFWK